MPAEITKNFWEYFLHEQLYFTATIPESADPVGI